MINRFEFEVTTNLETVSKVVYVGGMDHLTTLDVFIDYLELCLPVQVVLEETGEVVSIKGLELIEYSCGDYTLYNKETGVYVRVLLTKDVSPVTELEGGTDVFYSDMSFTSKDIANELLGIVNGWDTDCTELDYEAMANMLSNHIHPGREYALTLVAPYTIEE